MTTTADDAALEGAFEAYLAGRPVPEAAAGLTAFAGAVRATAAQPGRPSAALAELLTAGLPAGVSPAGAARPAAGAASGRSRRRRALLPALAGRFAAAGVLARAAVGAGVVVAGLGTAGFTGVLPASAQHTFATVVEAVTPFRAPDPAKTAEPIPPASPSHSAVPATGDVPATGAPQRTAPAHPSNFGGDVSRQAHESGGVDGGSVSSQARQRNEERKAQRSAGSGDDRGDGSSASGDRSGSSGRGGSGGDRGGHR